MPRSGWRFRGSGEHPGELRDYATIADSGSHMHRRFCPTCGVHVFSEAEERPHVIFVRAGTLDDPSIVEPTTVIWTRDAPKWAHIDPAARNSRASHHPSHDIEKTAARNPKRIASLVTAIRCQMEMVRRVADDRAE